MRHVVKACMCKLVRGPLECLLAYVSVCVCRPCHALQWAGWTAKAVNDAAMAQQNPEQAASDKAALKAAKAAANAEKKAKRARKKARGGLDSEDEAVFAKHQESEDELDPESLVRSKVAAQMEPPPELLMPLLPYQKEFLAWAVTQEQSEVRGGILADEMGMGKTIQVP